MQRGKTGASAELDFLQWCEPHLTATVFFLSTGWCIAQTALCCIVSVTLEDSADTTGQLALAILWGVVGMYFWTATGDFASRARRRWRCNVCTEIMSVVICALMCFITPQLSLIPRGSSLLELLESHAHDPASTANDQVRVEDVFSTSFWPASLLLSTPLLPVRLSRFVLVPFGALTAFFIRAACFRRLSDVMNGGVLIFISAIAIFSVHQREQLLRRCHDLDRREEDEHTVVVQLEQRASKNDARVRALEALTRSSCDMFLELSERLTICDSSPLLSVFFCQDVREVPFIFTVPELEQSRLSDFLLQASMKQDLMSACFTLPRGSAKLSVEYVSSYAALPHYLVAIHLQDPVDKARFAKDMAMCFGDDDSRISRQRTQEVCSPTSSKTTQTVDISIPEERCVGSDMLDMLTEEANTNNMVAHTFSALARVPSFSLISASPRTSLASSLQEPDQKRRGWIVRKPKKNSPMNSLRFPEGDDFALFAGPALEPRRISSSSLQFSHSVMSMHLELEDSMPDLPSPVVRTAEKEIQADLTHPVSQTVQTQFTWDSEDFVCYNCLFSRPPLAPSRREPGISGSSPSSPADRDSDTASESSSHSRQGTEKRLRKKRKKIHLRKMNEQSLSKVWSGQMPNYDLMVPHFQETGPKTIVRSLASLLKQWNLEYPSNVCCRYHAVTSLVVYLLTCELRCKCQASWRPKDDWQCSHCKMLLSKEDQQCSFCAFDRSFDEDHEEEGLQDHQGWPLSL